MRKYLNLKPLFVRYFVMALVVETLLIVGFGFMLAQIYQTENAHDLQQFMRGTVALTSQQISESPPYQQAKTTELLAKQFTYPIKLISTLPSPLVSEAEPALKRGRSYYDFRTQMLYVKPEHSPYILAMGPLGSEKRLSGGWIDDSIFMLFLWLVFCAVSLLILLYFYLKPLWRDLIALHNAANQYAQGDLNIRSGKTNTTLFRPLATAMDSMASRLSLLIESQQALTHAAAHELRTPIARLRFALTMLEDAKLTPEEQRYIHAIQRDTQELEDLIQTILDYARLKRGEVALHYQTYTAQDWIKQIAGCIDADLPENIHLRYETTTCQLAFDPKLMQIAIRNLLINAFKYAKSQVQFKIYQQDQHIYICVEDDGIGITEPHRATIFEPFRRLDRSRDRKTGGHGLGLSFVQLIARLHHGEAYVGDATLGGAKFTITLPAPSNSPN